MTQNVKVSRLGPALWESWIFQGLACALLTGLALAAMAPAFREMPNLDGGTFLYGGSQILKGRLPYVDFFDFRPPLVLYFNALGLAMAHGSRWGVLALEWVSLSAAALFAFRFLRKYFSWPAASLAVVVMVFNLAHFFQGGDLTDEFALPFQFLALLCLSQIAQDRPAFKPGLGIGLALGLISSLWLPLAGFGAAIATYLVYRASVAHAPRKILPLVWIAAGFALVWLGWAVFLKASGNWTAFWADCVQYYFFYLSTLTLDKITSVWNAAVDLFRYSSLVVIGVMGWISVIPLLLLNHEKFRQLVAGRFSGIVALLAGLALLVNGLVDNQGRLYAINQLSLYRASEIGGGLLALGAGTLILTGWVKRKLLPWLRTFSDQSTLPYAMPLTLAWLDLTVELGIAVFTWRGFEQHYVFVLPSLTILAASILHGLVRTDMFASKKIAHVFWTLPLGIGLLAASILGSTLLAVDPHVNQDDTLKQALQSDEYLKAGAAAGQSFLQWGMQTRLYFTLGLDSPTHYAYLAPLFIKSSRGKGYISQFFDQLRTAQPDIILDTRQEDQPLIIPQVGQCSSLDSEAFIQDWLVQDRKLRYRYTEKPLPYVPAEMAAVYRWVCENYQPTGIIGDGQWVVYRLIKK